MSTNYLGLITFSSNGVVIADYQQVRATLVAQFKNIYGSDIDLSTSSADGIYIETLSLIINNILQTVKSMYANLDTRTATGQFLDMLCALTNVMRKPATKSTVYVTIEGLSANEAFLVGNQLVLLDKNGTTWTCEPFTADANGEATVLAKCDEFGPVKAEVGWLYTTVQMLAGVTIAMQSEAIPGTWKESDSQLRARRDSVLSMRSTSVLEGIVASLLNVSGILDAQIYNNDTLAAITAKDGTSIPKNAIYIALRKNSNIAIANSVIGSIIYEKKTPGVHTTETTSLTTGVVKSYSYPTSLSISQEVTWKECIPISPTIRIEVTPKNYFVSGDSTNSTSNVIAKKVMDYLNNLRVSQDIDFLELQSVVLFADPKYRGVSTYSLADLKIDALAKSFTNPDTYFSYSNVVITGTSPANIIITIT